MHNQITRHAEKQENATWHDEKNKQIKTDTKLTWMLEIDDKDIKTVVITVLQMFKSRDSIKKTSWTSTELQWEKKFIGQD